MSSYLNESSEDSPQRFSVENSFTPLKPRESSWSEHNDKLKRVFEFEEKRQLEAFVVEMIKYNREADASIEVRFKGLEVGVIIYSLSGVISEIEVEASREINKIRKDVVYYYAKK